MALVRTFETVVFVGKTTNTLTTWLLCGKAAVFSTAKAGILQLPLNYVLQFATSEAVGVFSTMQGFKL